MSDRAVLGVAKPADPPEFEFIVAGHPDMKALGAPIPNHTGPAALLPVEAGGCHGFFFMAESPRGHPGAYWEALVKHAEGRAAVLVTEGNQHFGKFMLARAPLFDFVDPADPDHPLCPGAVIVPRRMVKASLSRSVNWLRGLVPRLRAGGCRCVIVVGTPPVREDYGDAKDRIRKGVHWLRIAESLGVDLGTCDLTPAPIMKRLWGVVQETYADVAREVGARFVPVFSEALDTDGYLATQFRGPMWDFTHANADYGRLMLKQIARAVSEAATASVPARPD